MKKLLFAVITLFALTSFTSCEDEILTDAELITKIQGYGDYDAKKGDIQLYFRVVGGKYILDDEKITIADFDSKYDTYVAAPLDFSVVSAGTWTVSEGYLVLTDADGVNVFRGQVEKDGKQIILSNGITLKK